MCRSVCLSLAVWWATSSCSLVPDPRPSEKVVIASWNVQNLFDEVSDGGEYPEFDPQRGWTRAQFWGRCDTLGRVIRSLGDQGPDLLVLQEVEGSHALEVLRTRFLPDLGYRHTFLPPDSVPGVKTAVLSRFPLVRTGLHTPPVEAGSDGLRPIVEVEVDLGGRSLVVLANHWKSRIPSPGATEGLRRQSAQVLARRILQLEARGDLPFIVALGDFNTSLELSRGHPERALVPASLARPEGGLPVFSTRASALRVPVEGAVWDPWETVEEPRGSYLYRGVWNRLDHAFVAVSSLGLTDWQVERFCVEAYAPEPQAYGARTPRGVSDHFPIVLSLSRR